MANRNGIHNSWRETKQENHKKTVKVTKYRLILDSFAFAEKGIFTEKTIVITSQS